MKKMESKKSYIFIFLDIVKIENILALSQQGASPDQILAKFQTDEIKTISLSAQPRPDYFAQKFGILIDQVGKTIYMNGSVKRVWFRHNDICSDCDDHPCPPYSCLCLVECNVTEFADKLGFTFHTMPSYMHDDLCCRYWEFKEL